MPFLGKAVLFFMKKELRDLLFARDTVEYKDLILYGDRFKQKKDLSELFAFDTVEVNVIVYDILLKRRSKLEYLDFFLNKSRD